jgi:hypothetical protein
VRGEHGDTGHPIPRGAQSMPVSGLGIPPEPVSRSSIPSAQLRPVGRDRRAFLRNSRLFTGPGTTMAAGVARF